MGYKSVQLFQSIDIHTNLTFTEDRRVLNLTLVKTIKMHITLLSLFGLLAATAVCATLPLDLSRVDSRPVDKNMVY